MSLAQRKSQFTDRRQGGASDGLRAGLVRATAEKKSLPLLGITVDQSLQVRVGGLDTDHLDSIVTKLQNGGEIDRAIVVFRDAEGKYLLADGFHRLEAFKRVGRKSVVCEVHDGDWEAARLFAETANMEHGLRINNDDKKGILESRLTRKYYENEDGILASNAVIAADLGVTDRTIAGWLDEMMTTKNFVVDLSKRVGKDGRVYEVEGIQTAQQQRAEQAATQKRSLSAIGKIQALCTLYYAKYAPEKASRGLPLIDDPDKGYEWCHQFRYPTFTLGRDGDAKFQQDYAALPPLLYQEFLRLAEKSVFIDADMEAWTDEQLAEYARAMSQRPPRQPNGSTFQQGMAQPKNPGMEYQAPTAINRQHVSQTPALVYEVEADDFVLPVVDLTAPYDPEPGDDGTCPYVIGQNIRVIETGEIYTVASVSFHGDEWRVYVEGETDYATLDQIEPYTTEPPTAEQAFSRTTSETKESREPVDEIAALRMAMNNLKAAATELKNVDVTTIRLLAPKIKELYIRDLRDTEDYVHGVVMAMTQLIGRAVNV